ncbi:hypothetical protein V7111_14725 [Neobacillus niacini]|uniref:hypothetical protein n=1 Tax=Neobacillus niacini TaxID=86668 RepID=UPI003001984A
MNKVKKLAELFELVQYYYEYRDQPIENGENFFSKIAECCNVLEVDLEEVKKEFNLLI